MGMRDYVPVFLSEIFSLKSDNFNKYNNKSGCKGLNPIPADIGQEGGHTLKRCGEDWNTGPFCCKVAELTTTSLEEDGWIPKKMKLIKAILSKYSGPQKRKEISWDIRICV